jgi:chaperone modulatory protein CbpM
MMKNAINIEHSELIWLDEYHEISLDELVELSGLSLEELRHLVESGALIPNNLTEDKLSDSWHFNSHCVASIRTLSRLKHDFELEPNALGLMLVFLERIQTLEFKLRELDYTKLQSDVE